MFSALAGQSALLADQLVVGAAAADGNDYLLYDSASGLLSYDADGNGAAAAIAVALLTSHPAISAADFLII